MTNDNTQPDAAADASIIDRTKESAVALVEKTKESTAHAYDATRQGARDAAHKTAEGIDGNPLSALIGGLAVGVALGALLPKTQVEAQHLGPIGKRLTDTAAAAARAAREQGRQELAALLPDKANAKEKAGSVLGAVVQAARDGSKTT